MTTPDIWPFWERVRSELAAIPLDAELTPAPDLSSPLITTHRVTMAGLGGVRLNGYFSHPLRKHEERFPALAFFPGHRGAVMPPWHEAAHGFACLALDPRGLGLNKQIADHGSHGYVAHHPDGLDDFAMRGVFADALRAIDFLESRPEVDGGRLAAIGASAGGGLTLACAAIDDRLSAAVADIPFLCNLVWAVENVTFYGPLAAVGEYLREHPEKRDLTLANYAHFDVLNLAERITCPTLVSVGMKDQICPPETVIPVFERIPALKSLISYPDRIHEQSGDFREHAYAWLEMRLAR